MNGRCIVCNRELSTGDFNGICQVCRMNGYGDIVTVRPYTVADTTNDINELTVSDMAQPAERE
jgi:NMD protein affecting ribosome stability and mRNA decay